MSRRRKPQPRRRGRAYHRTILDELGGRPSQRRGSIETHVMMRTLQGYVIRVSRAAWEGRQ